MAVPGIELGTAVVRTYPRHPMALAQQALTVNAMTGHRLTLGIGPSHRPSIEGTWGLSFDRPVRHVREYLSVLQPLLAGEAVDVSGETLSAHGELHVRDGAPVPVLLGALGPRMLALAGERTEGTVTVMAGPRTLAGHVCPAVAGAAERAGRPRPRVVAMLAVCVTGDPEAARARAVEVAGPMAALASYAELLRREGGPALLTGTEDEVDRQLQELDRAGVTDLVPTRIARRGTEEQRRTDDYVAGLLAR
jgi:F420-dependent oxidoreductase-like protein